MTGRALFDGKGACFPTSSAFFMVNFPSERCLFLPLTGLSKMSLARHIVEKKKKKDVIGSKRLPGDIRSLFFKAIYNH